jgi:hypothetical protein
MKKIIICLACTIGSYVSYAQTVTLADLAAMKGNWKGQLSYLDYSSNKQESIKASLTVNQLSDGKVELNFNYPNEPDYKSKEVYTIRQNGTYISDMKVIERSALADGGYRIVLEEKGKDGNQNLPATFHHIIELKGNTISLAKQVKFDGGGEFFERNRYTLSR